MNHDRPVAGRRSEPFGTEEPMIVTEPEDSVPAPAADELTAALDRLRRELDGTWEEDGQTDTERLRVALRGYGSLIDRILTR
jgi:hypothetical protein